MKEEQKIEYWKFDNVMRSNHGERVSFTVEVKIDTKPLNKSDYWDIVSPLILKEFAKHINKTEEYVNEEWYACYSKRINTRKDK